MIGRQIHELSNVQRSFLQAYYGSELPRNVVICDTVNEACLVALAGATSATVCEAVGWKQRDGSVVGAMVLRGAVVDGQPTITVEMDVVWEKQTNQLRWLQADECAVHLN